jgi:hypothetical protein
MDYYQKKYLKYKGKYISEKNSMNMKGGAFNFFSPLEDIYPENIEEDQNELFRVRAKEEGKQLLDEWFKRREPEIQGILTDFDQIGKKIGGVNATCFSDLYKWTMMPVICKLQEFRAKDIPGSEEERKNKLKVTFGVDLRDLDMRKKLFEAHTTYETDKASSKPNLIDVIHKSLEELKTREFNEQMFRSVYSDNHALNDILNEKDIVSICKQDGAPRKLVQCVLKYNELEQDEECKRNSKDGDVNIRFYFNPDKKYNSDDPVQGTHFIEATGPWHRVTWLETSMMQAVYESFLRYDLHQKFPEISSDAERYRRWLYGALLRCAKGVAFTRLVQGKYPGKVTPALFTGRRTGGFLFLVLQNLFFADHFKQFTAPGVGAITLNSKLDNETCATLCLGTSSCDAQAYLKSKNLPCLNVVGTHAHELSMVISILYPMFDNNNYELPITQIFGHYLYYLLTAKSKPIPMLPDTLGTPAFMKAATLIIVEDTRFLEKIVSARQDSGSLEDFVTIMNEFKYVKGKMASEIDDTLTLLKAAILGYNSAGAGGFYGDAGKVWNKDLSNPSMAVKAVRIEYDIPESQKIFYEKLNFPHVKLTGTHVVGYPIKVGDPQSMKDPSLNKGKLSLDKNLDSSDIEKMKDWVNKRRVRAYNFTEVINPIIPITELINEEVGPIFDNLQKLL